MERNKLLKVPVALTQHYCTGGGIKAGAILDVVVETSFYVGCKFYLEK
jgi:hypothetical protein